MIAERSGRLEAVVVAVVASGVDWRWRRCGGVAGLKAVLWQK